jgi:hemolysin D
MKSVDDSGNQLVVVRRQQETQFLPAALEIVESPASPAGRAVAGTIMAFFALAVAWAWFGEVDIIATAQGRVIPAGKEKVIQPLEAGIVRAIHVQDGDQLHTGDVLIELDPTAPGADRDRLTRDLMQARLDVAQFTALQGGIDSGSDTARFIAPPGAPAREVEIARASTLARASEQMAKLASYDQQIAEKKSEYQEAGAVINKLNATIPVLEEKENLRRQLTEIQFGNRLAYLDAQQQLLEAVHEREAQNQRVIEIAAAQQALERQRDGAKSNYTVDVLGKLAEAEQKASEYEQELVKAERKTSETELRSPIDGTVQQLAVHTVGGVVTPAQPLMVIVPKNQNLVVEALVSNLDVGFVHAGQDVELKVETFTFTRYGLLRGHVIDISPDTVTGGDNKNAGGTSETTENRNDRPNSASPAYVARISLNETSIVVDGKPQALGPGMAVTAEIKTGRRKIIDYLLSPLVRHTSESLRER